MSSNGAGAHAESILTLVDESRRHTGPAGAQPTLGGDRDEPTAVLARANASLRRVEQEFDELWRAAVVAGNGAFAEQLVDVSHVLRRAARLLEQEPGIG